MRGFPEPVPRRSGESPADGTGVSAMSLGRFSGPPDTQLNPGPEQYVHLRDSGSSDPVQGVHRGARPSGRMSPRSRRRAMAKTTADVLFERLIDWGVDVIFGLPGDGINGFFEALRTHQDRIRFIQVRHEEGAAFAACGYAKFSGRLGVCIATSGPGAIHLLNGLYDAKMDGAPVLTITGQTYHDLMGMRYQQEVNLLNLFSDVAVFNQQD